MQPSIVVFGNVRPSLTPAPELTFSSGGVEFTTTTFSSAGNARSQRVARFPFAGILPASLPREEQFELTTAETIRAAVHDGVSSSIIALGAPKSGKTHVMRGDVSDFRDRGLVPRAISSLFAHVASRPELEFQVFVSACEVYLDLLSDLLPGHPLSVTPPHAGPITIAEDPGLGMAVKGLALIPVTSEAEALGLYFAAEKRRVVAPGKSGDNRGHGIFTIALQRRARLGAEGRERVHLTRVNFCDLAGPQSTTTTTTSQPPSAVAGDLWRRESSAINRSLAALEQCILALSKAKKAGSGALSGLGVGAAAISHIPFRENKLTFYLQESLGGGSAKAIFIACIWPEPSQLELTLSTLRLASRLQSVGGDASAFLASLASAGGQEASSFTAPPSVSQPSGSSSPERTSSPSRQRLIPAVAVESGDGSGVGVGGGHLAFDPVALIKSQERTIRLLRQQIALGDSFKTRNPATSASATTASSGQGRPGQMAAADVLSPEQQSEIATRLKKFLTGSEGGPETDPHLFPINSLAEVRHILGLSRRLFAQKAADVEADFKLRYILVAKDSDEGRALLQSRKGGSSAAAASPRASPSGSPSPGATSPLLSTALLSSTARSAFSPGSADDAFREPAALPSGKNTISSVASMAVSTSQAFAQFRAEGGPGHHDYLEAKRLRVRAADLKKRGFDQDALRMDAEASAALQRLTSSFELWFAATTGVGESASSSSSAAATSPLGLNTRRPWTAHSNSHAPLPTASSVRWNVAPTTDTSPPANIQSLTSGEMQGAVGGDGDSLDEGERFEALERQKLAGNGDDPLFNQRLAFFEATRGGTNGNRGRGNQPQGSASPSPSRPVSRGRW